MYWKLDKIFDGHNFSSDKIFDTKPKFRQFCPTNFCPIRYMQSQENIVTSSRLEQSLSGFFQERIESNDYTILRVFWTIMSRSLLMIIADTTFLILQRNLWRSRNCNENKSLFSVYLNSHVNKMEWDDCVFKVFCFVAW